MDGITSRRGRPVGSISRKPTGLGKKINIYIPAGLADNLERAAQRDNQTAAQWCKNKILTLLTLLDK